MEGRRDEAVNEHIQNIRSGMAVMNNMYGVTVDEYDYIDMAIDALRDIKHFGITEYVAYIRVGIDGVVILPCNATIIDAVTTYKMGKKVFPERVEGEMETTAQHDDYFLQKEVMDSLGYSTALPGLANPVGDGYISYILKNNKTIKVDKRHHGALIAVAYKGISVDDEGYPMITRKQANAIAALVAKNVLTKRAFRGDKIAASMLELAITNASRLKQAASIPENITDNEIDEMLNAQTSFNRKTHRRPSKYSR